MSSAGASRGGPAARFRFDDVKSSRAFPMSGPCSHVTRVHRAGSLVYTGMMAREGAEGGGVPPSQAATAALLEDLARVLQSAGAGPRDVVSTTFFQRDIMAMPVVGRARASVFVERHPPSGSIPAKHSPFFSPANPEARVGVHTTSALAEPPDACNEGRLCTTVEDGDLGVAAARVDVRGGLAYTSLFGSPGHTPTDLSAVLSAACKALESIGLGPENVAVAMVYVASSEDSASTAAGDVADAARKAVAAHFAETHGSGILVVTPPVECVIGVGSASQMPVGVQLVAAPALPSSESSESSETAAAGTPTATVGGYQHSKEGLSALVRQPESLVFTGTLAALDNKFEVTSDSVEEQVAYTLQLLRNVLDDVGAALGHVIALNLFIVHPEQNAARVLELVRAAFKPDRCPAFAVVGISPLLLPRLHFELCAVAALV